MVSRLKLRFVAITLWLFLFASSGFAANFVYDYDPTSISNDSRPFPLLDFPSHNHFLGTTSLSQDVLTRFHFGFYPAIAVVTLGVLSAIVFGIALSFSAHIGGRFIDKIVSVGADALYSIPSILVALALMVSLPTDAKNRMWLTLSAVALGVGTFFGAKLFRVLRVNLAKEKQSGYYMALYASGVNPVSIYFKHLLPNSLEGVRPILTGAGADAILTLAGLGFIGAGISALEGADWGYDLARGIDDLGSGVWWTILFPALGIGSTILLISTFLEVVRKK